MRTPIAVLVVLASTHTAVARADDSVTVRVEGSRQVAFIGDLSCVAPCSLSVSAGTYRAGLGQTQQDHFAVLRPGTLRAPHGGSRAVIVVGGIVMGIGVLGTIAAVSWALFPVATLEEQQTARTLGVVGGIVAGVGLISMIAGFVSFARSPRRLVLGASGVGFAF